jgi:hypothetical protein
MVMTKWDMRVNMSEAISLPEFGCECADSDARVCYWLRFPNQMELDGRDYCLCDCHKNNDDCDCQECSDGKIL